MVMAALVGSSWGCTSMKAPLQTVPQVSLPRYMGDWYVIANIPYFAEKNCVDSIESYALRADGRIDNWFQCRKKSFDAPLTRNANAIATIEDKASNATWSVKFFRFVSFKYLILELDPDYRWVAVGHPSRRYGWIMARSKTLNESTYQSILHGLSEQGYDPGKFEKVPQRVSASDTVQH
jgi:apolipoprotein D and lipocalin family protein